MPDKETYIYLDLNGKLDVNYFQNNKIFFKMINLDDKPMVQIGNYVFEGKYEDYLGTKVFFIENQNYEASDNIFERQSPLHLKYFTKTAKILQLKWKSIPITTVEKTKLNEEYMELRFKETYNTVLEKFEKAELNIKDVAVKAKDVEEKIAEKKDLVEEAEVEPPKELEKMEIEVEENEIKKDDSSKFEILKEFIRLPKKIIENQKVFETKQENLVKIKDAENYPVLKQLFLQNVDLEDVDFNENDFNKYVNIEKSILDGVIPTFKEGELNDDLKIKLLHRDNFNNFRPLIKLAYLSVQLEKYKDLIKNETNQEILTRPDEFGRNLIDKYQLLKQLIKDLWYIICLK